MGSQRRPAPGADSYSLAEAAELLGVDRAVLAGAVDDGALVPDAAGRLDTAALAAFAAERERALTSLAAIVRGSEESGLYDPDSYHRLVTLGIVHAD